MKTQAIVGERGQITIPKLLRDRLGIRPGQRLDLEERDGKLIATKDLDTDDPIAAVYGILDLGMTTDEYMDLIRGPVELPPEPGDRAP
jgi:AbrB family looped-hinge helix DNA binding protein